MSLNVPKHLKRPGRALYRDLQREYNIVDAGGLSLLCIAAECLDRLRSAQAAIDEHGELVQDRYGSLKVNPAAQIEKDARAHLMAALKALHLDLEPVRATPGNPGLGGDAIVRRLK
mgnify:CR=1 FL=1